MQVGDDVVVIGVGGIGLLCMMVAKAAGPGRLVAIDPSPVARANAKRLGATHVIDPTDGQAKKAVYDILPGGPDLVVEAAGTIGAVRLMVDLRRRGTTSIAMQSAIRLMDRGVLDPGQIISHRFPLAKIHEAMETMARPDRNKIMINP